MRRAGQVLFVGVALLGSLFLAGPAATAAAPTLPGPTQVGGAPVNDLSCRSRAHPVPLVLVHGTFSSAETSWDTYAPQLKAAGYCLFALDYGFYGTGPMPQSAAQLKAFIDQVLAGTGAPKVSILGHSQGGALPRYYINVLGGADTVDDLIGLAPSSHGTTNPGALAVGNLFCPACLDQAADSDFQRTVAAGGDTRPGPSYTVVSTYYDLIVTPPASQFLTGPRSQVTDTFLQWRCWRNTAVHTSINEDPVALQWALDALSHPGPANPWFRPRC